MSGYREGTEEPQSHVRVLHSPPPAPPTGRQRPREIMIWLEVPDSESQIKRQYVLPFDVDAYLETLNTDWEALEAQSLKGRSAIDNQLQPFLYFQLTIWIEFGDLEVQRNISTSQLTEARTFIRDVFELWEKVSK